ncbi:TetR/AcrR family transcriptional regulator [uncultured Limosilactobacillus sp.]|uniref:TetR/AcrR family transcriptional regulator n=1 Tax=uncultured Limosilactobacillus sp. TaxID=2837629 RepID=UPI00260006BB|nr:TetR/AcrR family transcriptional regulator [uncultured Limosilactobacillus sp.]
MADKKLDPRVIKTRTNLRKALVYLMQNEKIDSISVQKITDTAHITRGTFYLHYKDKKDFIQKAMDEIINEFFDSVMISSDSLVKGKTIRLMSLNKAFEYIEKNADIFIILLDRAQNNNFYRQLYSRLTKEMEAFIKEMGDDLDDMDVPMKVQVAFTASAMLGLIAQWLNNGLIYTAKYMTKTVSRIINRFEETRILLPSFFDDKLETGLSI